MQVGQNNLIITAHPDDEVLWCGGLPIRYSDRNWMIVCCTTPRADPVRAEKFKDACGLLGADAYIISPRIEPAHDGLIDFGYFDAFEGFDAVFTHNSNGEYGHPHHKQVHQFVRDNFSGKKVYFGYGQDTRNILELTPQEYAQKLAALKCYDHQSPLDAQPKWRALLDRYFPNGGFHREYYC